MRTPENRVPTTTSENPGEQEFIKALDSVSKHAKIVYKESFGSQFTQIVLGEWHFVPHVQRDMLRNLTSLKTDLDFKILGTEGSQRASSISQEESIDYKKATTDDQYMKSLLDRDINATVLFADKHSAVITESVEDPTLRAIAGKIDQKYYELFSLRKEKGEDNMTPGEKYEFKFWQEKEKQIVLGDRSTFMIRNLSKLQREHNASAAVLVCGFSHLPLRPEYGLFSILPTQRREKVNTIIAMPNTSWELYGATKNKLDPFDFFTPVDELEVNPYKKT